MPEPVRTLLPDRVPWLELEKFADTHEDPWVQRLGSVMQEVYDSIRERGFACPESIVDFINNLIDENKQLEYSLTDAEEERRRAVEQKEAAEHKVNALRYDLDANEQAQYIETLKSSIVTRTEKFHVLHSQCQRKDDEIERLTREVAELKRKLNTWTIIASQ